MSTLITLAAVLVGIAFGLLAHILHDRYGHHRPDEHLQHTPEVDAEIDRIRASIRRTYFEKDRP